MSEIDNLQNADGIKEIKTTIANENEVQEASSELNNLEQPETTSESDNTEKTTEEVETADNAKAEETDKVIDEIEVSAENEAQEASSELNNPEPETTSESNTESTESIEEVVDNKSTETSEETDKVINEIEESNAKDAEEDEDNKKSEKIEVKEYDSMSLEALAIDLEKLVKSEKIQAIKTHVDTINRTFKTKFQALVDTKKEEFIKEGGNEIDFYYSSATQKRFKEAYREYRNKLNEHYKSLEKNLKQNLANKLEIIEELKGLLNLEENINSTYKHFKELQERWRNTGPIPRDKYNNAWNTYHHHVERFYDFLHLNRDLRDLDFKHNLDKKLKIIERTEELAQEENVSHSFRELQELHKMWKEELGPVAKEYRETIWERFKAATKIINDKRQEYYKEIDKVYEKNLEKKHEIIASIDTINAQESGSHNSWQKKIKEIETLRDTFFKAGKVPIKVNEATWAKFKDSVRTFNKQKNAFYKGLKKGQFENLQKKLELIKIAEDNKNSEDIEVTTALMKKIQSDWKKIGHVPRKDSDKIWNQFKGACNHFFDKIHANRNAANKESLEVYNKKKELLGTLKTLELTGDKDKDLPIIKQQIESWRNLGKVPNDKRYIEGKFNKAIDGLFSKLKMDKEDVEMIKYENKLDNLNSSDNNTRNLDNERSFIRKRIDEVKSQINQLENNLQFFTNVDDENPLVKEVHNNIKEHKQNLNLLKNKLSKIKELY